MLLGLQVGAAATPTPAGAATRRTTFVRSEFGGTSTACGTQDYLDAQADAAQAELSKRTRCPARRGFPGLMRMYA